MELRKREDLAFHFDPKTFPGGVRVANTSGEPAVISLHGTDVGGFTINGVQAQPDVSYTLSEDMDIQGRGTVGVHIRSGTGSLPRGPDGNG